MPLVLDPIQSGYNLSKINENFEKIQDTWDEKLDRVNSGSFYNQMDQTLDMNSNEIINVVTGDTDNSLVTKGYVDAADEALEAKKVDRAGDTMTGQLNLPYPQVGSNATNVDYVNAQIATIEGAEGVVPLVSPRQQGDGVTTVFNSPASGQVPNNSLLVNIDGVTQRPLTDYTANASGQVVFVEAPELNADIDVTLFEPVNLQEVADFSQVTSTGSTTPRTLADRFADAVNVKDFGATGDGTTDDTQAFITANADGTNMIVPPGTYRIQNWVPLEGTTVDCKGTIQRLDNTLYSTTTSSAAIVITNSDITILGANFIPQGTDPAWSGAIVIENGENILIKRCKFKGNLWSGVYGHEDQNGSLIAEDVTITHCIFDGQGHNAYLADIKNLTFSNNTSKNSSRDGLKTNRNCQNHIITDNYFYDNGNGTPGQSQDGIDLFVAGFKTVVTGNYIYGNVVKGIDIKFGPAQDGEALNDWKHIIANNYIFNNQDSGIEVSVSDTPTYGHLEYVTIDNNEIYSNTLWGVLLTGVKNSTVTNNFIYANGRDGIRCENSIGGLTITGNTFDNNNSLGIHLLNSVEYAIVKNNTCSPGANQTTGISMSCPGICRDNYSENHPTSDFGGTTADSTRLRGEMVTSSLDSSSSDIALIAPKVASVAAATMSMNLNATGVNVVISKRNKSDGSSAGTLFSGLLDFTSFVPTTIPLTASNSTRALEEDQIIYVTYSGATPGSATVAMHLMT